MRICFGFFIFMFYVLFLVKLLKEFNYQCIKSDFRFTHYVSKFFTQKIINYCTL